MLNTLEKGENNIKPLPKKLPMIVKPKIYSRTIKNGTYEEELGGYLLNGERYTDPLMIDQLNFEKSTLIKNKNIIYDLINNINSLGFKINTNVLNFIESSDLNIDLTLDSRNVHPLSEKDKLTKYEYLEYTSFLSKRELEDNILNIAKVYSNVNEFFLPKKRYFTGRLYCISECLNYQSTELAKSLLLFSKSEKIYKWDLKSIQYLKAYGANCFGNKLDKKSWKDRSKWVDDNTDKIINFKNGELILKAEKKLLFIAFFFEYNTFLESINNDKDYFETNLPIQLDATCNGYQHLSLLSLDYDLAKELNLKKASEKDEPKDFYSFTGVKLTNYFQDILNNPNSNLNDEERESYTRLSHLTIARKVIKKAIMTIPYKVSYLRIIEYMKKNFVGDSDYKYVKELKNRDRVFTFIDDPSIKIKEKDFSLLGKGLLEMMRDNKYKLSKLLKYLNELAQVLTKLGLYIPWTKASGVEVRQSYLAMKKETLKIFTYKRKTFSIKVPIKSKYNKTKQVRAFMPNLIHSLDADALALLVSYYFNDNSSNIKNIYTVHDCFAVTANNVEDISNMLSNVYQKIYTKKQYLRELDKSIINHIKSIYGDNCFDDKNLVINTGELTLKYPSIESVLGKKYTTEGLISESAYLIH